MQKFQSKQAPCDANATWHAPDGRVNDGKRKSWKAIKTPIQKKKKAGCNPTAMNKLVGKTPEKLK